jgi:2,4-dienoyl-CoA reductase-like NADH-dependent reductase (Old Yellow Enzyme family)
MTHYHRLFSPIEIGKLEIRNRIVLTGHGTGMGRDHRPDDRMIAYYEQRARGEVGLIMLGSQQVHPSSPGMTGLLCNFDDSIIAGIKAVGDAVHRHGAKVFGYLSHMGLAASARPTALWSASNAYEQKYGEVAHAMTIGEIDVITKAFAAAAMRCLEAGLDGLQIHAGHGLLLQQFLSPLTNRRTDQYGGSEENRIRFPCEVLASVRRAVGDAIPVGIRCSGDELIAGGLTAEAMARIVPRLVEAGRLDYVDVSAGSDGDLVSNMRHEPPMGLPSAPFASVAHTIRARIDVPVIHGTRIETPEAAEALLARGDADMAGMCRALIADPLLPVKSRTGRRHEIIPCVACEQACFGRLHRGHHISCVGNPVTGREQLHRISLPALTRRRVVVVGGGPSGMEVAIQAAGRGHDVALFESGPRLGGRMILAARADGREEWMKLIDAKISAIARADIHVHLDRIADADAVRSLRPDALVIATGASFNPRTGIVASLSGSAGAPLLSVDEAMACPENVGQRVLVVDYIDRQPAIVAAIMLAQTADRKVSLVTPSLQVGLKLETQNLTEFLRRAYAAGLTMKALYQPTAFEGGYVHMRNPIGGQAWREGPFDSIVLGEPGRPNAGLAEQFNEDPFPIHVIGDAYAPRDVEAAILEGFETGRRM